MNNPLKRRAIKLFITALLVGTFALEFGHAVLHEHVHTNFSCAVCKWVYGVLCIGTLVAISLGLRAECLVDLTAKTVLPFPFCFPSRSRSPPLAS